MHTPIRANASDITPLSQMSDRVLLDVLNFPDNGTDYSPTRQAIRDYWELYRMMRDYAASDMTLAELQGELLALVRDTANMANTLR